MPAAVDSELEFRCPRCGQPANERFYGPCTPCREQLVATFSDTGIAPEAGAAPARFEPGMHVVPNHVATKD
jgi:hypothetical protein